MRFARPFFSSRAFNVNIFREQISGREYPPLSPFPIPFLCFPTYSRSIRSSRSSIPSHSRGSVFRFTRFRPFCESALLKEESTHENRIGRSFSRRSRSRQRTLLVYRSCCGTRDNRAEESLQSRRRGSSIRSANETKR